MLIFPCKSEIKSSRIEAFLKSKFHNEEKYELKAEDCTLADMIDCPLKKFINGNMTIPLNRILGETRLTIDKDEVDAQEVI